MRSARRGAGRESAGRGTGPAGGEPGVRTSEPEARRAERGLTPPGRAAGAGRGRQAERLRELAGPNIKGAAGRVRGAGRGRRGRALLVGGAKLPRPAPPLPERLRRERRAQS